jgi:acetolactate synthase regulatory subunit
MQSKHRCAGISRHSLLTLAQSREGRDQGPTTVALTAKAPKSVAILSIQLSKLWRGRT